MLTFHSFRALGSTYSRLHHRLPKSFNADTISSLHFFKIDTGRKPVFWTLRNYVTNSQIWNDFQISSYHMTGCRINKFGIFTISWLRSVCMNVKIRNKFIEIKYSVSYGLVIFIRLFLLWNKGPQSLYISALEAISGINYECVWRTRMPRLAPWVSPVQHIQIMTFVFQIVFKT